MKEILILFRKEHSSKDISHNYVSVKPLSQSTACYKNNLRIHKTMVGLGYYVEQLLYIHECLKNKVK